MPIIHYVPFLKTYISVVQKVKVTSGALFSEKRIVKDKTFFIHGPSDIAFRFKINYKTSDIYLRSNAINNM